MKRNHVLRAYRSALRVARSEFVVTTRAARRLADRFAQFDTYGYSRHRGDGTQGPVPRPTKRGRRFQDAAARMRERWILLRYRSLVRRQNKRNDAKRAHYERLTLRRERALLASIVRARRIARTLPEGTRRGSYGIAALRLGRAWIASKHQYGGERERTAQHREALRRMCGCRECGCVMCAPPQCHRCECDVCFPDGRDCGECACRTCYPSGRDCRDAQCDVCHPHADDCAEPQCYRCERANRPLEYSYKPAPLFHEWDGTRETTHNRAAPGVAYFGIEIEAEAEESPIGIPYTIRNNKRLEGSRYYYKHDGSVGNGFETVSHPASFRAWCERGPTMQWCETMRRSGYRSYQTDSCGHHVHVSRTALGSPALARLLLFFAQNARTIAKWSRRKSRLLSQWARIETDTDSNIILEKVNDNGRGDRRVAINMQNERTIEFRLFRGTLLSRSILANIGLVELLVGFVNRPEMNDSLPSFFDYANAQRLDPSRTVAERAVLSYVAQFIGATTVMQPETTIVVSPEDS